MAGPQKNHADGHRQRLRERFLRAGLDGLLDYEAIELLLTYAVPRRDMKPLAKELLEAYGSIEKLLDAAAITEPTVNTNAENENKVLVV